MINSKQAFFIQLAAAGHQTKHGCKFKVPGRVPAPQRGVEVLPVGGVAQLGTLLLQEFNLLPAIKSAKFVSEIVLLACCACAAPGEVRLRELPPDPLLPRDGVHGDARVARPLHVLRVRQPQQDLADTLLRQRIHQT